MTWKIHRMFCVKCSPKFFELRRISFKHENSLVDEGKLWREIMSQLLLSQVEVRCWKMKLTRKDFREMIFTVWLVYNTIKYHILRIHYNLFSLGEGFGLLYHTGLRSLLLERALSTPTGWIHGWLHSVFWMRHHTEFITPTPTNMVTEKYVSLQKQWKYL